MQSYPNLETIVLESPVFPTLETPVFMKRFISQVSSGEILCKALYCILPAKLGVLAFRQMQEIPADDQAVMGLGQLYM